MPAAIAIPLITGAATAGASVLGAKMSGDAARDAAGLTTTAANHAADLQDAANRRGEQFTREQAQAFAEEAERDRRANYDLSAKRRQGLGSIGDLLGVHVDSSLPAYVPGVVPDFMHNAPASVGDALGGTYNFAQPGQPMDLRTPFPADQLAQIRARVAAQSGGRPIPFAPSVGSAFGA